MTTEQFAHFFADPLRSNRPLASSEEAVIRNSYWETHSSLLRLEAQIKGLMLRHHALCNHRQMLATLLSPVRRLMPELLAEVFRYCLPRNYRKKGAHKAVMLPSHVCRHWRNVALSTPTLWTNIVLCITDENFESRTTLMTTWFSRSGALPLLFTLEGRENVGPIITFLLQHCNRWQNVNFSVPFKTHRCLETAKGNLQHLETINIQGTHTNTSYSIEHIFDSAPRLRKVSFDRRLMLNGLGGSWTQLTELDTGTVSYTLGDCLALLQSMRSLQKLGIRVDHGDGVVERHHRHPFSHPLVSLCDRAERVDRTLFDHNTLPSLRNLYICEPDSDWSFIPFLERSSPPLQHFSLRVPDEVSCLWADNMTQILQHIPSLHSLCLKIGSSEWELGSFLKGLSPRILDTGQVECFIPRLNTISI